MSKSDYKKQRDDLLAALKSLEAAIYVHEDDCSYRLYNDFNFQQVFDAIKAAEANGAPEQLPAKNEYTVEIVGPGKETA